MKSPGRSTLVLQVLYLPDKVYILQPNNIIVINNDELKPFYPNADEISKKYPEHYIKVTNEASKVWTDALIDEAIEGKYNVLYEGTGRKIKIFERMISAMKKKGYKIKVLDYQDGEGPCSSCWRFFGS